MVDVGAHYVLELYDCPSTLLDDLEFVKETIRKAAKHAATTLLKDVSHKFHPQGVTALALLAESHISVHTWPEIGYVAADAFTCGDRADPRKACEFLMKAFKAKKHHLRKIVRGPALTATTVREERLGRPGSPSTGVQLEPADPVRN